MIYGIWVTTHHPDQPPEESWAIGPDPDEPEAITFITFDNPRAAEKLAGTWRAVSLGRRTSYEVRPFG